MSNGDSRTKIVVDWAFRILSLCVIPLVGWIITVEVNIAELRGENALQDQKIERIEGDVAELKVEVKEIEANKRVLIRLEAELKNANTTLGKIETAINNLGDN